MDSNFVYQLVFWMFAPSWITSGLQSVLYVFIPKPSKGLRAKHYSRLFIGFIGLYLIGSILYTEASLDPSHFQVLQLAPNCSEKDLKTSYRSLSLTHHPDKYPHHATEYLNIRKAYDVLKDPLLRRVYSKVGPGIHDCVKCSLERDYIRAKVTEWMGFYIGTGLILFLMNMLNRQGSYWKYLLLIGLSCLELSMVTSSFDIPWYTSRPIFQKISVLRQCFVFFSIAMDQVSPHFFPPVPSNETLMSQLEACIAMQTSQSQGSLKSAFEPFKHAPTLLARRMEKLAIDANLIETDPAYASSLRSLSHRVEKSE